MKIAGVAAREEFGGASVHAQEEAVAVRAVVAVILRGDKGGKHLLVGAAESSWGEEHGLGEAHHVLQQRRVGGEALQDSGDLGPAEGLPKLCVELLHFGRRVCLAYHGQVRRVNGRCSCRVLRASGIREAAWLELQSCSELERAWTAGAEEATGDGVGLIEVGLDWRVCADGPMEMLRPA